MTIETKTITLIRTKLQRPRLISEPVDQAALVGMINHLNGLGMPVVSVECLSTSIENEPIERDDA